MNKKSKIIASGILITSAIGATSFAIIDPYNIISKKNVEVPEKKSNFKDSTNKEKDKKDTNDLKLNEIKDGTYFGVSKGYGGDIKVKVTIEKSKIKNIEVVSHSETPKYYEKGSNVIKGILKENSTDVDSISGATLTSNGIKNAVRDALSKAGFDIGENNKEVSVPRNNSKVNYLKAESISSSIDLKEYKLKDGEYIGEAIGFKGNVKVKVIIKGGKLTDVSIISHNDDNEFFNNAKGVIIEILKNQGTVGVDTISGATYSSKGILNAVNSALTKVSKENSDITNTINISKNNNTSSNIRDSVKDILEKNGIKEDKNDNVSLKEHKLKDGEYIGESEGFKGNLKVKIIVKNDTLVDVKVISYNDDEEFFNNAKGVILKILKNQNTDGVDTISGATYSSRGIIDAVNKALKESMKINNKAIIKFAIDGNGSLNGEQMFEIEMGETWKKKGIVAPKPIPVDGYVFKGWNPELPDSDKTIDGNETYQAVFVKKADKAELDVLIAKKVDTENKTPETVAYYKEKLEVAKVISADEKATQSDVDNAKRNLNVAIDALLNKIDKIALKESIDKEVVLTDKTEKSVKNYNDKKQVAITVYENNNVTQEQVNTAKAELQSAIDNLVKKADKSKLKILINQKINLSDKTYETIKIYNEKKAIAEDILGKESVVQEEVDKAIAELEEAIKGLKISPLSYGQVYDVSTQFAYSATSSGGNTINHALQKTEVKLNENGKIDVTMTFKSQKGYSFLNKEGKFIIKNGEESESLKPEIKDGLEIFKFTLPKFEEIYNVDVYLPSGNTFGNDAHVMKLLWKTLRPSGTVAPETNPLKSGNDYAVMVEMRNYNSPDFSSMADEYMEKPSTISVDNNGVAKLTLRMKQEFSNTRIYADKKLENTLNTQTVGNKEVTFVLPDYNKEGWVWGTSHVLAMKMDVKFGLKINWVTLKNTKDKTEMLTKDGIVSGKMGSYDRKYPINVNILVDRDKDIFKDLIVTDKSEYSADGLYMKMAIEGILKKILDKPATMETVRNIDVISGATISSNAIKETLLSALKESIDENNKAIIEFAIVGNGTLDGKKILKSEIGKTWKGQGFIAPTPVADDGYFFDGWDSELPDSDEAINENKTYKAIFVKKADKTELDALIAKKVDTENKVPSIVADYKEKLDVAKAASADEKAKQSVVDKAKRNLEVAIYALDINLKPGQVYDVSAKFTLSAREVNRINKALQKTEVKLNEDGKIDVIMTFKAKDGYSFLNGGRFRIGKDGEQVKQEIKDGLEIFKFTLSTFDTKYDVDLYFPSESVFIGIASKMELLWDTLTISSNSSTENQ